MTLHITLASTSVVRRTLLSKAGVPFAALPSDFDEDALKVHLLEKNAAPRDVALALADGKAKPVARSQNGLILGCDQVLSFGEQLFSKPRTKDDARDQLKTLRGNEHQLLSAAVIYEDQKVVWSYVGTVKLVMRDFSDEYLKTYLDRNWPSLSSSVGGYKLEEEGIRLFSQIEGDYFTVLGMPLLEILAYFGERGAIAT